MDHDTGPQAARSAARPGHSRPRPRPRARAGPRPRPRAPLPTLNRSRQCVIQALVVGRVADRIRRRRSLGRRHPPHQHRLRHCVIVLGERHPHRPPRVVEPQRPALELPGRRRPHRRPPHGRPSSPPPPRPRPHQPQPRPAPGRPRSGRGQPQPSLHLRSMPGHQLTGLAHAPMGGSLRNAASLEETPPPPTAPPGPTTTPPTPTPRPDTATTPDSTPPAPTDGPSTCSPRTARSPRRSSRRRRPLASPPSDRTRRCRPTARVQRRDPPRPLNDPPGQLLRTGVATEVAARRSAPQRPRREPSSH